MSIESYPCHPGLCCASSPTTTRGRCRSNIRLRGRRRAVRGGRLGVLIRVFSDDRSVAIVILIIVAFLDLSSDSGSGSLGGGAGRFGLLDLGSRAGDSSLRWLFLDNNLGSLGSC